MAAAPPGSSWPAPTRRTRRGRRRPATTAPGTPLAKPSTRTPSDGHEPAVVALPTFTVNLADKDAPRYLRTTVSLVVNDTDKAASLSGSAEHKPGAEPVRIAMARSAILELLTTKTAEELMSAEGKTALKKEIAVRASKAFRFTVNDVLLAEFVVQ